ncbi:hypothetical protein OG21DRAFT_1372854, partial [Imleria badia]
RMDPRKFQDLVSVSEVAFSCSTDLFPELNRWLRLWRWTLRYFKVKLTSVMIADFAGCWIIEKACKYLFAELEPKPLITGERGRREAR